MPMFSYESAHIFFDGTVHRDGGRTNIAHDPVNDIYAFVYDDGANGLVPYLCAFKIVNNIPSGVVHTALTVQSSISNFVAKLTYDPDSGAFLLSTPDDANDQLTAFTINPTTKIPTEGTSVQAFGAVDTDSIYVAHDSANSQLIICAEDNTNNVLKWRSATISGTTITLNTVYTDGGATQMTRVAGMAYDSVNSAFVAIGRNGTSTYAGWVTASGTVLTVRDTHLVHADSFFQRSFGYNPTNNHFWTTGSASSTGYPEEAEICEYAISGGSLVRVANSGQFFISKELSGTGDDIFACDQTHDGSIVLIIPHVEFFSAIKATPDGVGGFDFSGESYVSPQGGTNDLPPQLIVGDIMYVTDTSVDGDLDERWIYGDLTQGFDTDVQDYRAVSPITPSLLATSSEEDIVYLGDNLVVAKWRGNGSNGIVLAAGRVESDRTITWGTPTSYGDSSSSGGRIGKISATKFVCGVRFADTNSKLAIATVNTSTLAITFGTTYNAGGSKGWSEFLYFPDVNRLVTHWQYFSNYVTMFSLSGDTLTQTGWNGVLFDQGTEHKRLPVTGSKYINVYSSGTKTYVETVDVSTTALSRNTAVQIGDKVETASSQSLFDFTAGYDAVNKRLHFASSNDKGYLGSVVWDGANGFSGELGVDQEYDEDWNIVRSTNNAIEGYDVVYDAATDSLIVPHQLSGLVSDVQWSNNGMGVTCLRVVNNLAEFGLVTPWTVIDDGTLGGGTGVDSVAMVGLDDQADGGAVILMSGSNDKIVSAVLKLEAGRPPQAICNIKPTITTIVKPARPGAPYYPGQAYAPAYCIQDPCYEVSTGSAGDGFVYQCRTEVDQDSLVSGFPAYTTVCGYFPVSGLACESSTPEDDPYAPNYDPNSSDTSDFCGVGVSFGTRTICPEPVCYPEIPYIPPTPPTPPTPAEYAIDYDLGWNYDVLLGTGKDISVDISTSRITKSTAGIVVGFSEIAEYGFSGLGKYKLFVLFEGKNFSVYVRGALAWGPAIRADDDIVTLSQAGNQGAVYLNGVLLVNDDTLYSGKSVACASNIYKAGDSICVAPDQEINGITYASAPQAANGGADVTLPALENIAYEGSYGIGDVNLPALESSGSAINRGGADIDLPILFAIGSEGSFGYAATEMPPLAAEGYEAASLGGYANIDLPPIEAVGADASGYAYGDVNLPALSAEAEASTVIPQAQGADVNIPHFLQAAHGLTGTVGGVQDGDLPAISGVGADRPYGEGRAILPAITAFGGEIPEYDGLLFGTFSGLEVVDLYGTVHAPHALEGSIGEPLEGEMYGGASLDQDIPGLEVVTMTGTLDVVARLDGYFLAMQFEGGGITGAYGEIDGTLGEPIAGELWGGATLEGDIPGIVGALSGTVGLVGALTGDLPALDGELAGTIHGFGGADATLPALESLWGLLDGTLPGLDGTLAQTAITVSEYTAWVMNLKTGAISQYPAYAFDFMCRWRDQNFIVRSDGIYRVGGEYDIDQPIEAGFTLPPTDMGTSTEKISPRLYLQGRLDGQFAVTAQADEKDPVRSVSVIRPGTGYYRCKLPRGIRGTYLEFDVDNVSGSDFEIEQVDALVADTGRKI